MSLPNISIIGAGALGSILTRALMSQDVTLKSVFNRTESKAKDLADELAVSSFGTFPESISELGALTFLTVPDSAIIGVAQRLSKLKGDLENFTFVHCSGNESAEVLQPLKLQGATIASFHPLQTFTAYSRTSDFKGIYFSLQGDVEAFPRLRLVAKKLGAQILEVTKDQKSHLHAAAVLASNYLTTLLDTSVKVAARGGLSDEKVKNALLPLVETTLQNASQQSFIDALSGPIKRGDIRTVEKHLELLDGSPELKQVYCVLGLRTVELAEASGSLEGTVAEKMRKIVQTGV